VIPWRICNEFSQLIWQLGGLSFLWYIGPPSSKGGGKEMNAKRS
jgi:hypothetical protein